MPANTLRIRSLTKEHALPGVRIGYALAHPSLIARLERHRPTWTTGAAAQAAAIQATQEQAFVARSRDRMLAERDRLQRKLPNALPSSAPYFLLQTREPARAVRLRLLTEHKLLLRDCSSFGLPHHLRLCPRLPAQNDRLLQALELLR